MKIEIELPESVEVSAGQYATDFRWDAIPADKLAAFVSRAACVGVAKSGNDAASGAKAYADKSAADEEQETVDVEGARAILIDKWIAARYESGDFGAIRGAGMSRLDKEMISLARPTVKAKYGKKYEAASDPDQLVADYIAAIPEADRAVLAAEAADEIARKDAAKERRARLSLPTIDL